MRSAILSVGLILGSLAIATGVAEYISRLVLPLPHGTLNMTMKGEPLNELTVHPFRYRKNLKFRQVSSEFDVQVTIDKFGNRISTSMHSPEMVFLGDSFTFGHGLNDGDTFVSRYCNASRHRCANLGRNGSGTLSQMKVLKHFLEVNNWRPSSVKVFVFAMTKSLAGGNDLLDNYYTYRATGNAGNSEITRLMDDTNTLAKNTPAPLESWLVVRRWLLKNINLVRLIYYRFAPIIRLFFSPGPKEAVYDLALEVTRGAFGELRELGQAYGFTPSIFIIHPIQDILGNTDIETTKIIESLAGNLKVTSTAHLFREKTYAYYYAYDGHLNRSGAHKIADFLLLNDKR